MRFFLRLPFLYKALAAEGYRTGHFGK